MFPITWKEFREYAAYEASLLLGRDVDDTELLLPEQAAAYLECTKAYTMPGLMACDYVVKDVDKICCLAWDEYIGSWVGWLADIGEANSYEY